MTPPTIRIHRKKRDDGAETLQIEIDEEAAVFDIERAIRRVRRWHDERRDGTDKRRFEGVSDQTDFDWKVFNLYREGLSYREIAKMINQRVAILVKEAAAFWSNPLLLGSYPAEAITEMFYVAWRTTLVLRDADALLKAANSRSQPEKRNAILTEAMAAIQEGLPLDRLHFVDVETIRRSVDRGQERYLGKLRRRVHRQVKASNESGGAPTI